MTPFCFQLADGIEGVGKNDVAEITAFISLLSAHTFHYSRRTQSYCKLFYVEIAKHNKIGVVV